jgi:hypothetical protein
MAATAPADKVVSNKSRREKPLAEGRIDERMLSLVEELYIQEMYRKCDIDIILLRQLSQRFLGSEVLRNGKPG